MRFGLLVGLCLAALSLAGCSGGSDDATPAATPTTTSSSTSTSAAPPKPAGKIAQANTTITSVVSIGGGGTSILDSVFDLTLLANSTGAVVEAILTAGVDTPLEKFGIAAVFVDPTTMAATPVAQATQPDARGVLRMVLTPDLWDQRELTGIVGASTEGGVLVQWGAEIHVAHFIDRPLDETFTSFPAQQ